MFVHSFNSFFSSLYLLLFCMCSLHREEEEGGGGHTTAMENEKRMRREIANSNERRRMQSINAGFQSLRSLLPHHEGEKLSKVSVATIISSLQLFTINTFGKSLFIHSNERHTGRFAQYSTPIHFCCEKQ